MSLSSHAPALIGLVLVGALAAAPAEAHFQLLYPGETRTGGDLDMLLLFSHPFNGGPTMQMEPPEAFSVTSQRGEAEPVTTDLIDLVEPYDWTGADGSVAHAYMARIPARTVRSMGDYVFSLTPAPYYEATEDKFIQQFTKTILNVGGVPGNWDQEIGLPAEIRPLDKPYANWVGGVFRGIVLSAGAPVPFAEVEVEYVNRDPDLATHGWTGEPRITAPHPALEVLSIRADANGLVTIGLPKAGWWGIAALGVGPRTEHEGKELSQDAVLWVEVSDIE